MLHMTIYRQRKIYEKSFSDLANTLSEVILRIKCKYVDNDKNVKLVELNINIVTFFLNTQTLEMMQQNTNIYAVTKSVKKSLMKN